MEKLREHLGQAGAMSLTLGILTLVCGVALGVLGIINGGKLLGLRKEL